MANKDRSEPNYLMLHQELDAIIDELQMSNLDIDRVLSRYERGIELVSSLESYLTKAENKVKKIAVRPSKAKA